MSNKNNLPSLQDLVSDIDSYKKSDELNYLLNQEPPKSWIKEHPFIKVKENGKFVPHRYISIDKIEYLLRRIFKEYKIEILREGVMFNAMYVTIRLHYRNLITSEWSYHDGTGAVQVQTSKGSTPADLSNINNGAVAMGLPSAESYAIKDACKKFGKLFGADLMRSDTLPASLMELEQTNSLGELERLFEEVKSKLPEDETIRIQEIIIEQEENSYKKTIEYLKLKADE